MAERKGFSWALYALFPLLITLAPWSGALSSASAVHDSPFSSAVSPLTDPPRNSTGLTDVVQWDNYTLFIHGQRIFLQYANFQFYRPTKH